MIWGGKGADKAVYAAVESDPRVDRVVALPTWITLRGVVSGVLGVLWGAGGLIWFGQAGVGIVQVPLMVR